MVVLCLRSLSSHTPTPQGTLRENRYEGDGKLTWKDGSYFSGEWKDNRYGHCENRVGFPSDLRRVMHTE